MPLQRAEVAEVVGRADGGAGRAVRRIEPDEIRIVGVGVIGGEVAGQILGRGPDQHCVERFAVVVVFLQAWVGWEPVAPAQLLFLLQRGLGGMVQRVERRPVGVGNGALGVVGAPLVLQQVVALLGHPRVGGRPSVDRQETPGVGRAVVLPLVVGTNRGRLPFAAQDVAEHVIGHVGVVAAKRVSGPRRNPGVAVHRIHDAPHLGAEPLLPARIVVVVAWRQLRPHAVDQPHRACRMCVVPAPQRPVEGGGQDRVEPNGVRVRLGHQAQPGCEGRFVARELGRKFSRQGRAKVDALDVERLPSHRGPHLEVVPRRARRNLRLERVLHRRQTQRRVLT